MLRRKAGRVSGRRDVEEVFGGGEISRRRVVEERAREISGVEDRRVVEGGLEDGVEGGICGAEAMERYFKACAVDTGTRERTGH